MTSNWNGIIMNYSKFSIFHKLNYATIKFSNHLSLEFILYPKKINNIINMPRFSRSMSKIEYIKKNGEILAIIVRSRDSDKGLEFPTPNEFPLQLGFHSRLKGEYIKAHTHMPFKNLNIQSQEIFVIEKGKLLVDLYHGKTKHTEVILTEGNIILLNCGHSIKFLEDTKMIEVKQGPYRQKEYEKIPLE